MQSLRAHIRSLFNTEALEQYLNLVGKSGLLPYVYELIARNLPELEEARELLNIEKLYLLPVWHSGGILILGVPDKRLLNTILNLCPGWCPWWDELASIYSHYVASRSRLVPLLDIGSLLPLIPLTEISLSHARQNINEHKIWENLSKYFKNLAVDILRPHLFLALAPRYPMIMIEETGYAPLIEPYFEPSEVHPELIVSSPNFYIYRKFKAEVSPVELYKLVNREGENFINAIVNFIAKKLYETVEKSIPLISELVTFYNEPPVSYMEVDVKDRIPRIELSMECNWIRNRIFQSLNFDLYFEGDKKPILVIDLTGGCPFYPTIVFYPEKLGERGKLLGKIIAISRLLNSGRLATVLRKYMDQLDDIIVRADKKYFLPIVESYRGENYIMISGNRAEIGYPIYYQHEGREIAFQNAEKLYEWFRELAREQVKKNAEGIDINVADIRNIKLITV